MFFDSLTIFVVVFASLTHPFLIDALIDHIDRFFGGSPMLDIQIRLRVQPFTHGFLKCSSQLSQPKLATRFTLSWWGAEVQVAVHRL